MNSENIKKITTQAIEQLIEALNAGRSEALTRYLAAVAKFHRYSFQNILLIAKQCPQATRVAGFRTWRSLGRFVRKNEKGLMILAPLVRKTEAADECTNAKETRIFGYRAVYVFDVSQTEGTPLPTIGIAEGEPGDYFLRLEQLVREQGITLEYSAEIVPAKGMSCGTKIILLPGMAPAEQFSTLVHELAHEMLHRDARHTQTTQRIRETEAEAVAFVVNQGIGLATNSVSKDYISLYSGDAALLLESLEYNEPRYSISAQFISMNFPLDRESCSNCKQFVSGYGFDFNYRLAKYAYFDSAANLFPGSGSYGQHGAAQEGLIGLKLGPTFNRWGVFFNLRNGFIHYDKTLVPDDSSSYESTWRYALDLGGTVEFYASLNSTVRLNAGTTLVHYLQGYPDPEQPPTSVISTEYYSFQGSPYVTTAYVFRF